MKHHPSILRSASPWFPVIALILLDFNSSFAGDIHGRVEILQAPRNQQEAASPWARQRSIEGAETVEPAGDAIIAVVYLEANNGLERGAIPVEHPQVNQKGMMIVPHITPVVVGTTVDFPNSDNVYHNLFSLSPARTFDLGRYGQGKSKSITFKKEGEVRIFCDIHPSMSGVVLVLPNHFFSEVKADGLYEIKDVPTGTWRIHAWHETLNEQIKTVTVPDTGAVAVDFILGVR